LEKELRNLHIINFISFFYIFFGAKLTALSVGGYGLELTKNQDYIPNILVCSSLFILIRLLQYLNEENKNQPMSRKILELYEENLYLKLTKKFESLAKKQISKEEISEKVASLGLKDCQVELKSITKSIDESTQTLTAKSNVILRSNLTNEAHIIKPFTEAIKATYAFKLKIFVISFSRWAGFDISLTEKIMPIIICIAISSKIFIEKII
jgi:uncharacterized protein (DUF1697 family)